tara:strand:- start:109 stop:771 length:663 start_codon:yes stop_codon:yes gene_type:complete
MGTVVKKEIFNNLELQPNVIADSGEKLDKFVFLTNKDVKSARIWIDVDAIFYFWDMEFDFFKVFNPKVTVKFNSNPIFQTTFSEKTYGAGFNTNATDGRWDVTQYVNKNGNDKIEFDVDYAGNNVKFVIFSDIIYEMNHEQNVETVITTEIDENTWGSDAGKGLDEFGKNVGKGAMEFLKSPSGIAVILGLGAVLIFSLSGGARRMAYSGAKSGYKRLRK